MPSLRNAWKRVLGAIIRNRDKTCVYSLSAVFGLGAGFRFEVEYMELGFRLGFRIPSDSKPRLEFCTLINLKPHRP